MIEFDVETTGFQYLYNEAFCWQFFDGTGEPEIIWTGEDGWRERVQAWLDRGATEGLRAWNSKFDFHFAEAAGFTLPPENMWHDGMIGSTLLDERRYNALKAVGDSLGFSDNLDRQKQIHQWLKEERARRKKESKHSGTELVMPNYSDVPRDLMTDYALEDVLLTKKVCDHQAPMLAKSADLASVEEFEREVLGALFALERRGFPADRQAYHRLEIELAENLEKMQDNLTELASVGIDPKYIESEGWTFNPNAPQQVLAALKRRKADLTFVTGNSMDKENLETVDDELAVGVLDFRSEYKVLSTYVRKFIHKSWDGKTQSWKMPFICPDERIHASYRQMVSTGRMSCSDPNVQNQPRDDLRLRYNFIAEPGYKLVCCDLNSIEMAIFAAYAGEGRLMDAVREGTDIHEMTADFVGIRDRVRPGGHVEKARQRGKTFGFLVIYGGNVRPVRKLMRCTQEQARLYLKRYHDAFPEVNRLQTRVEWGLDEKGFIKSAWGRRYRLRPREAYKGVNYLVQGTAADLLKASLVRLHHEGVPIVACVHDELIAHVPEAEAEATKARIIAALIEHPRITEKVPLRADGDIVDRWSQVKDPEFKPKWALDA
jgi:DNA polymerase-1